MAKTITDFTARPVYQHYVYDKEGRYLFLKYSFTNLPDEQYFELLDMIRMNRKMYSEDVRTAKTMEEKKAMLNANLPDYFFWTYGINEILPQNEYSNDGSRRKKALQRRLKDKTPLFEEVLYEAELASRPEYFSGTDSCDDIKAAARKTFTDEYWQAYLMAEQHMKISVI